MDIKEHIKKGHIILYGKSGIGKSQYIKDNLNINKYIICNNNTGINYIKHDIINFCKIKKEKLKIIVFDNCECLTIQSQLILRVIMEKYAKNNRFVFICTNYNKLIVPIHSRSIIIKYENNIKKEKINRINIIKIFKNNKENIIKHLLNENYNIKYVLKSYCQKLYEIKDNSEKIINDICKLEKYVNNSKCELIYLKLLRIHYNNNIDLLLLFISFS